MSEEKILPFEKSSYRNMSKKQLYAEILRLCDKMAERYDIIKKMKGEP